MTFLSQPNHLYSKLRCALAGFTSLVSLATFVAPLYAESDLVAISEREILKRQENSKLAEQLVITARRNLAEKKTLRVLTQNILKLCR